MGRGAAISAATEELNLGRASAVGAPAPHYTSSDSPTLGFWETWPLGEVGAASLCAEAVEDAVSERARDPAATGTCSRGWGSAGGGSAMRRRAESVEDAVDEGHGGVAVWEIFGIGGG